MKRIVKTLYILILQQYNSMTIILLLKCINIMLKYCIKRGDVCRLEGKKKQPLGLLDKIYVYTGRYNVDTCIYGLSWQYHTVLIHVIQIIQVIQIHNTNNKNVMQTK